MPQILQSNMPEQHSTIWGSSLQLERCDLPKPHRSQSLLGKRPRDLADDSSSMFGIQSHQQGLNQNHAWETQEHHSAQYHERPAAVKRLKSEQMPFDMDMECETQHEQSSSFSRLTNSLFNPRTAQVAEMTPGRNSCNDRLMSPTHSPHSLMAATPPGMHQHPQFRRCSRGNRTFSPGTTTLLSKSSSGSSFGGYAEPYWQDGLHNIARPDGSSPSSYQTRHHPGMLESVEPLQHGNAAPNMDLGRSVAMAMGLDSKMHMGDMEMVSHHRFKYPDYMADEQVISHSTTRRTAHFHRPSTRLRIWNITLTFSIRPCLPLSHSTSRRPFLHSPQRGDILPRIPCKAMHYPRRNSSISILAM